MGSPHRAGEAACTSPAGTHNMNDGGGGHTAAPSSRVGGLLENRREDLLVFFCGPLPSDGNLRTVFFRDE